MKVLSAMICVIALGCGTTSPPMDDAAIKETAKTQVEEMNVALLEKNYAKVTDLTHPKLIEMAGGRAKMISTLEFAEENRKSRGGKILSVKVYAASDPVRVGSDVYVVVPFLMEMKVPRAKASAKAFVIGVSTDFGKSWGFVNGDMDIGQIKKVLPNLPEGLKLPAPEQPRFEED